MTADPTWEFDYIKTPADLTAATGSPYSDPLFPAKFWDAIYHGMAGDDMIIQLFDRSHSYAQEHAARYLSILNDLRQWDALQQLN